MISIGIIAPDPNVYADSLRVCEELGLAGCTEVREATLEDALPVVRSMIAGGAEVIVSRGSTVEGIESSGLRIPVVNIPLSIHDMSSMLIQAKKQTGMDRPRIAVITYTRIDLDLKACSGLLDMDLHIYHSRYHSRDIAESVRLAMAEGAHVVVGGNNTLAALRRLGKATHFARYVSSDTSIRQALLEARQIVDARRLEQQRAEQFKAVVESSRDGIVTVDATGRIMTANPVAGGILRLPRDPVGVLFADACPISECLSCLDAGDSMSDELVYLDGQPLLLSLTPIRVGNAVTGAVINCQRARHIVELEAKIRKDLAVRGLVARHTFADIAGISPQIRDSLNRAAKYAAAEGTVLLSGATGTGKELFAQAIHNAGPRRKGPFVAVNCAALPPTLLESELFGYEEGAFTGANRKGKQGLFELAHQGTIFLDEVSGMDHYGQTRLLRVLQERSVLRLGGDKFLPVDFRVVAASNVDLWALAQSGEFREDLFYRLNVLPLALPPLRERQGDIAVLAVHFAKQQPGCGRVRLAPGAVAALEAHPWPGNVRELRYCIQRLCLLLEEDSISERHVADALASTPASRPGAAPAGGAARLAPEDAGADENPERRRVVAALRESGGRQGLAAAALGMDKSTLYRKMRRYGIRKSAC